MSSNSPLSPLTAWHEHVIKVWFDLVALGVRRANSRAEGAVKRRPLMKALARYWEGLDNKRLRLVGAASFIVACIAFLLFLNNPADGTRYLIGLVFLLIGVGGLMTFILRKRN
jgi:hypothetical protein